MIRLGSLAQIETRPIPKVLASGTTRTPPAFALTRLASLPIIIARVAQQSRIRPDLRIWERKHGRMKAEHRKELQTNYLADRMGRLVQGMRAGPQSTSSMVAWVFVSLTIGTVVVWYVASGNSNRSPLWVKFDEDSNQHNMAGLINLAGKNPATLPARASRFQVARINLQEGLASLYSIQHDSAVLQVERARKLYTDLVRECTDDPMLPHQALIAGAKAG